MGFFGCPGFGTSEKSLEDVGHVLAGDAWPIILDHDADRNRINFRGYRNLPVALVVKHRVADEIVEQNGELEQIRGNLDGRYVAYDLEIFLGRQNLEGRNEFCHELIQAASPQIS
jgi:hypothetical protein